jgi:hypothetical protein
MHGYGLFGFVGIGVHFIFAGAIFYFLFHITRSLKRIADHFESKKIA